ncbi:hypothetical protein MJO29_005027 [Puccinia striiformis f. sp. tritici]|nr:hypothetical protein MJO29_005027 [Puccinia striiformis f. sp. tritici]
MPHTSEPPVWSLTACRKNEGGIAEKRVYLGHKTWRSSHELYLLQTN